MYRAQRYQDASLHPPTHHPPRPKSGDGHSSPSPPWVLLEDRAYIADHRNHTTAYSRTRDNEKLQATFFFADPPLVSYFCMSLTDSKPTEFAREPRIIATEASLVLISSVHGSPSNVRDREMHDFYIYQADGASDGGPSLNLLPHPTPEVFPSDTPYYFHNRQAGLLRYRTKPRAGGLSLQRHGACPYDAYIIASLCTHETIVDSFLLCIYDSKDETWSSHIALLDKRHEHVPECPGRCERVITIQEETGTLGWVDLWRGITVCDVLPLKKKKAVKKKSKKKSSSSTCTALLRYIPLPPSILENNKCNGSSTMHRDIAVVQGRIKYIEVQMQVRPVSYKSGTFVSDGWTARTWSIAANSANSLEENWRLDSEVRGRDISFDNNTVGLDLLPTLLDDKGIPQPTLERIHIGHPTLSLLEDHIVYFMTKVDHLQGSEAWVIAVDMKNKVLRGVSNFDGATRNRCMTEAYMHSSISGHLNNGLGTRVHLKRPGIQLPEWYSKKIHLMGHVGADVIAGCSSLTTDDYREDTMSLDQNS